MTLPMDTDLWNALRERRNKRLPWQLGQIGEREEEIWKGRYGGERAVPVHTKTDR